MAQLEDHGIVIYLDSIPVLCWCIIMNKIALEYRSPEYSREINTTNVSVLIWIFGCIDRYYRNPTYTFGSIDKSNFQGSISSYQWQHVAVAAAPPRD